jgi:hypothetical protein
MRNPRFALALIVASSLAGGATLAAGAKSTGDRAVGFPAIADHIPQVDGPLATTIAPDGTTWAVWSYRAAGEYDVAIVSKGASGVWSAPSFYGRRDGIDQIEPALAVDAGGNLYLAYASRAPQSVVLAVLPAGSTTWSQPSRLTLGAFAPSIRIVGGRVVIAYRNARGVAIVDVPTLPPPETTPQGIQDGPDTFDPLGITGSAPGADNGGDSGDGNGTSDPAGGGH